jgi:hypothetical protein
MNIRFYLDPTTGQPHILEHGVDEKEVQEVLAAAGEDRPGRDGSRIAVGQTRGGRYLRVIYVCSLPGARKRVCSYSLRTERQTFACLPETQAQEADMTQSRFPLGWDEDRVRRVLAHYEQQTSEEAVAEDEAAFLAEDDTVMKIPHDLVPAVRELIAKHQE